MNFETLKLPNGPSWRSETRQWNQKHSAYKIHVPLSEKHYSQVTKLWINSVQVPKTFAQNPKTSDTVKVPGNKIHRTCAQNPKSSDSVTCWQESLRKIANVVNQHSQPVSLSGVEHIDPYGPDMARYIDQAAHAFSSEIDFYCIVATYTCFVCVVLCLLQQSVVCRWLLPLYSFIWAFDINTLRC